MHGTNQSLSLKEVYYRMSYFKLFLTNTEMERVCVESANYVQLKGNQMFTITVEKLKACLVILLASGYAGLSRREMYLERREEYHNLVVLVMMTKPSFYRANDNYIWLIITLSIVQKNLRKCNYYLMLLTNNAF